MRSKLEELCASLLNAQSILFEYEKQKVVLVEGFSVEYPVYEREGETFKKYLRKVQPITYTPDFIGDGWLIETKGYERDSSKIKWKLFKKYLKDSSINIIIFKPHNKREILECIDIIKSSSNNQFITCLKPNTLS